LFYEIAKGRSVRVRVEEIFHALADFSQDARRRYFAEQKIDERTRNEVEALLAFDTATSFPLDAEIGLEAKRALERFDAMGRRCGAYQLSTLLGRGGMGFVYSAAAPSESCHRAPVKCTALISSKISPQISQDSIWSQNSYGVTTHHPPKTP